MKPNSFNGTLGMLITSLGLGAAACVADAGDVGDVEQEEIDVAEARLGSAGATKLKFRRGDANGDGQINIADVTVIGQGTYGCEDWADVNDDRVVNGADATYLANYLYKGGAAPKAPFATAGFDPVIPGNYDSKYCGDDNDLCYDHNDCTGKTADKFDHWCRPIPGFGALGECIKTAAFVRGDVNRDGSVTAADAAQLNGYLYNGNPADISCDDAGDVNDDGALDIADGQLLLAWAYNNTSGFTMPAPTGTPGPDPTKDNLRCEK